MKKLSFLIVLLSINVSANSILIKSGQINDGLGNSFIGDILIVDKKIVEVGKFLNSSSAKIIEAKGKPVTPGLISPISNIGVVEINALDVTNDDSPDFFGPGFSVFNAFNPHSTLIPWNRSNGVTSSISTPGYSSQIFKGMGSFYLLDGDIDIIGNADVAMYARLGAIGGSRAETIQIMESMFELALNKDELELEELLGTTFASSMDMQLQDIQALSRVVNREIPLVLEVNRAIDILQALRLKNDYDLELVLMSVEEAPLVLDQILASGVSVIIDPMDNIPDSFDELASNIKLGGILSNAGIKVMFSTQRSHNYHLMRQGAGNAVAHGMTYQAGISGMTSIVADVFNIQDRGSIKEGYFADIVIWSEDPLEPSAYPTTVIINGSEISLETRASRLTERYTDKRDIPSSYKH
jgi:imidazolonepropionase-like amidohydrolase|tara:strand:- start:102 stop:1334 length:1233 start_codon:yes stop_codon:yes gene_type:complete